MNVDDISREIVASRDRNFINYEKNAVEDCKAFTDGRDYDMLRVIEIPMRIVALLCKMTHRVDKNTRARLYLRSFQCFLYNKKKL